MWRASNSLQIVCVLLTFWGAIGRIGDNEHFLPSCVRWHVVYANLLIRNSAKQGRYYCLEHRNTSYYQSRLRFEIHM